jgi:YggT family protein
MVSNQLLTYWYFHLPNFILAVLMYTLLARVVLGIFIDRKSQVYIWRFFCSVTDPVVRAVAVVTPKAAPPVVIWLFGFVWLFWLRLAFFVVFKSLGLAPPGVV